MTYILVKSCHDYADEFDLNGVMFTTRESWDEHVTAVKAWWAANPGQERTVWFGTNEYLSWESAEDYLSGFTVFDITEAEYATLTKVLQGRYIGDFEMLEEV